MERPLEIIGADVSSNDVRDEANRRGARAGYCNKQGEPPARTKIMITCGWGEPKLNVWPRDKNGNLIE